jgi:O-antigen ligase
MRDPGREQAGEAGRSGVVVALLAAACFAPAAAATVRGVDVRVTTSATEVQLGRALLGALLVVFVFLATRSVYRGHALRLRHPALAALLVAYWALGAFSDAMHGRSPTSLTYYAIPAVVVGAALTFPSPASVRRSLVYVGVAVCASSLVVGALGYDSAHYSAMRILPPPFHERLAGITDHPNALGAVAAMTLVGVAADRSRWWWWVMAAVAASTLVLSESRGAWLAATAGLVVLGLGAYHGKATSRRVRAAVLVGGGVLFAAAAAALTRIILTADDEALNQRFLLWRFVLRHWRDSPFFGLGPSVWRDLMRQDALPAYAGQAHNQVLDTLLTVGLCGLLLLILLFALWARAAIAAARMDDWLPLSMVVLLIVECVFESTLSITNLSVELWIVLTAIYLTPDVRRAPSLETEAQSSRADRSVSTTTPI